MLSSGRPNLVIVNYVPIFEGQHLTHGITKNKPADGETNHFESLRASIEPSCDLPEDSFMKDLPFIESPVKMDELAMVNFSHMIEEGPDEDLHSILGKFE